MFYRIGMHVVSKDQSKIYAGFVGVIISIHESPPLSENYKMLVRFDGMDLLDRDQYIPMANDWMEIAPMWCVTVNVVTGVLYASLNRSEAEDAARGIFEALHIEGGAMIREDNVTRFKNGSFKSLDVQVWAIRPNTVEVLMKEIQFIPARIATWEGFLKPEVVDTRTAAMVADDENAEFERNRRDLNHPLNQGDDVDGQEDENDG